MLLDDAESGILQLGWTVGVGGAERPFMSLWFPASKAQRPFVLFFLCFADETVIRLQAELDSARARRATKRTNIGQGGGGGGSREGEGSGGGGAAGGGGGAAEPLRADQDVESMFSKLGLTKVQRDAILEFGGGTMYTLSFLTTELLTELGIRSLQVQGFLKIVKDTQ